MYRVMIADDESIMTSAMESLIDWKALDCELIYSADNGRTVLDYLEDLKPDILILDINMPEVTGIDIAKYVWENKLPCKVILLTGYADFSYAQQAVSYDVVEYVTKTGAFDQLVLAIKKAQRKIDEERKRTLMESKEILAQNFLKAVFDGSLYEEEQIREESQRTGLDVEQGCMILLIRFALPASSEGVVMKIQKGLMNFLKMTFREQMLSGVPIRKNVYAILLRQKFLDYEKSILDACGQIVDMMDNFMKLYVFIGVSDRFCGWQDIKICYEQAESALDASFFDETSKINLYQNIVYDNGNIQKEIDVLLNELEYHLKQGEPEALDCFRQILEIQRKYHSTIDSIENVGIAIRQSCDRVLGEYEKTLYDVSGVSRGITRQIRSFMHVKEYSAYMEQLIEATIAFVSRMPRKKNGIVYQCEKLIDEHFMENISVSEISEMIGVSSSYLSRVFKEENGETIIQTINQKKLEKAKEYLLNTDRKIYEIADALGFENITYFSHFFKKATGISPKDYSDAYRKDKNY